MLDQPVFHLLRQFHDGDCGIQGQGQCFTVGGSRVANWLSMRLAGMK